MTATTSPALARTGPWVLITAILGSALVFVDSMVVTLALPVMQADLDARLADLQWVLSGYTLMLAALILVGGTLGDAFGRRRVFVAGVASFVAASLACGLARDIEQLIAARVVQGLAGAALVPAAMALISTAYPSHRRGWAFGIWAAAAASTIAAAPVLGGLIVEALSWRWIFFINLPLGLAVIALAVAKVPETRNPNQAAGFDLAGAATATLGLGALAYGLIAAGDGAARAWPALAIAGLALGAFVAVEWRNPKAMLPPVLFASPTFSGISLITVLYWG